MKIRKGDTILIISGKDRAKTGKVLNVFPKEETVLVEGINLKKKHLRPKKSGEKGQIVQVPAPVHASNVKLVCPKCSKAARVGYKTEKNNPKGDASRSYGARKYRFCKKCSQEI